MRFEDPQDRKALVMGLALHEQGKQSLNKVLSEPPLRHIPTVPPLPPPPLTGWLFPCWDLHFSSRASRA